MTEDLTTYTEVDPNSHISTTASRATGTGINRNEVAYSYSDKGASYFNALDIDFDIFISNLDSNDILGVFGITNTVNHYAALSLDDIKVIFYYPSGGGTRIYLMNGPGSISDYMACSLNTTYYCTLERAAGSSTVVLNVYSDAGRTALLDTLTVTISAITKHQYVFAIGSMFTNQNYGATGYVENIVIHGATSLVLSSRSRRLNGILGR